MKLVLKVIWMHGIKLKPWHLKLIDASHKQWLFTELTLKVKEMLVKLVVY
jgi:hypothetical protein